MTTDIQPRQPKGIPTGGEFAAKTNAYDAVDRLGSAEDGLCEVCKFGDLSEEACFNERECCVHCCYCHQDDDDFGKISNLKVGSNSPWGEVDHVEHLADGLAVVGTAGHGGIKLSPERNRGIPEPLRNSNGWYEEDCDAYIVAMFYPRDMAKERHLTPEVYDRAEQAVKDYYPDEYEQAFNTVLEPGQSRSKDERIWREANAHNHVSGAAFGSGQTVEGFVVPEGQVLVASRVAATGEEGHFLIPADEYRDRGHQNFAFDADQYPRVNQIGAARQARRDAEIASTSTVSSYAPAKTEAGQRRLDSDLDKRWRDHTGRIYTLREDIEAGKFHGKTMSVDNGKRIYMLRDIAPDGGPSGTLTPVSKAVWDSYDGADDRSEARQARHEAHYARDKAHQAMLKGDRTAQAKYEEKMRTEDARADELERSA